MNDFMKYGGAGDGRRDLRQRAGQSARLRAAGQSVCPVPAAKSGALQARLCHHPGDAIPGTRPATCRSGEHAELRQTALHTLQELGFAINELGLYLDTHRSDSDAVELYNQYVELYGHQLQQMEQNGMALTPDGSLQ